MPHDASTQLTGRHYRTSRAIQLDFAAGKIARVRDVENPANANCWLAPGFIDVQSNGYGGQEFSSPELTADQVAVIARVQASFGVTQFCPTVTTAGAETIAHSLSTIAEACRRFDDVDAVVAGIHLEGPYIASQDGPRGAHPLEHCRPPDWEEFERFQQAAEDRICILTLSPEFAGAAEFIRRVVDTGVVVAIGHTGADSSQIRAAVDAGARLSTHLGNGAHRSLRRHPNYLWDQLAEDRLSASLIVDGHHLPSEVVQTFVRAKTPQRCILVSDLSGLAGLPPGRYDTQLCELEILADGRLVIAGQDQLLAGASRPIGVGVARVMRDAGVDLATAIAMVHDHPARLLGREPIELIEGDAGDVTQFEWVDGPEGPALKVRATVVAGQLRYER